MAATKIMTIDEVVTLLRQGWKLGLGKTERDLKAGFTGTIKNPHGDPQFDYFSFKIQNQAFANATKAEIKSEIAKIEAEMDKIVKDNGRVPVNDPLAKRLAELRRMISSGNYQNQAFANGRRRAELDLIERFENGVKIVHQDADCRIFERTDKDSGMQSPEYVIIRKDGTPLSYVRYGSLDEAKREMVRLKGQGAEKIKNANVDKFGEEITKGQSRGSGHIVHFHTKDGWILEQDGPVFSLFHGTKLVASGSDRKKVVDHMSMSTKGGVY
jgi:hypothetical protein